jgi:hypothetical protein
MNHDKGKSLAPTSAVQLRGYDKSGKQVYQKDLPYETYYSDLHDWDDNKFRLSIGLVRLTVKIYNQKGQLEQDAESAFSGKDGKNIGGKAIFLDGTSNARGIYEKPTRKGT